ncbi:hypothetical protein Sked_09080 [Sanguibacter keddieii DSM 10542]|uniref:Large extracellular alpha-helical protein n=1 Tax=Sanguibacter keddieii (strain ATCC 51767 / DSM 10542 / NCFB 3025 / ST-74) TaxID=446469 RepID=D1BC78_SANKS|nr:DUF5719 family protein [Sanguibacter keddieii]ACZ20858.1 hypothetical protein Sked_09080 [Sanguibacter keddieii DSM 10542]
MTAARPSTPRRAIGSTGSRRDRRRSVARAVVVSLVVVGATGALAAYGDDLVPSGTLAAPAGEAVAIEARSTVAVCPGPVVLADPGSTADAEFGSTPDETLTSLQVAAFGAATTSVLVPLGPDAGSGEQRTVQGSDPSAYAVADQGPRSEVLRSTTAAGDTSDAAASTSSATASGDLRGLAAASCAAPGVDQWLVGGGTELGSSTRLVLSNPSRTPATVTISLWGPSGALDPAGPTTYLVPPGEEVSTLVEGLAAQQRGLVVRATSAGALVTATLQHSVLEGLTARGVDLVVPGDAPATAQVVTGVSVEASEIGDPDVASVRLLAPDEGGTATLLVLGEDGQRVLRGAQTTELVAGTVTDVSLSGLPAGSYSVVVQAEVPVVAGAVATSTGEADDDEPLLGTPVDRTWVASHRTTSTAPSSAVLPEGTQGTVTLVALPADLDGTTDLAGPVPIVYDEESGEDAESAEDSAGPWAPAALGTLEVYGTDGTLLGSSPVELATGQTTSVEIESLSDDEQVGAVRFVPTAGAPSTVEWSLTARADAISGSITTLQPTAPPAAQDALVVRRSQTVGLPNG